MNPEARKLLESTLTHSLWKKSWSSEAVREGLTEARIQLSRQAAGALLVRLPFARALGLEAPGAEAAQEALRALAGGLDPAERLELLRDCWTLAHDGTPPPPGPPEGDDGFWTGALYEAIKRLVPED